MIIKNTIIASLLVLTAFGASASDNENMYLVKGNRVVGKYAVDAVDYITFNLPDDVLEESLWLTIDKVGKNSVTYTVNTADNNVAYAHNLLSFYDVNYVAMDMFGDMLENLDEESALQCIQYALASNAFVGIGKNTFTQNDFEQFDMSSEAKRFSVTPGTKYYLCAWQVDPTTTEPMDTFVYQELTTESPAEVDLGLDVTFAKYNDYGMVLNFTGSENILYVCTCWGQKSTMEAYAGAYGLDFLMGTFGQRWSMSFLSGVGDMEPGIENATWPVYEPGEYIMYVRAYDFDGNMQEKEFVFNYVSSEDDEVPVITVFSKEKSEGHVKINFEIAPSNVEEAYVRMMSENDVEDRLNMGYTYPELAMGRDSIDITNEINTTGEYTFESNDVQDQWTSILIYAKCKDGGKTTLRINFYPDSDSDWSTYLPFHAPKKQKAIKVSRIRRAGCPAINRIGK
ncbi:MAG: hypothetical protein K2K97_03305 [Muribaculaceae bacterium]|nr:hypothetical protein [Muribaculaceae bacterium]